MPKSYNFIYCDRSNTLNKVNVEWKSLAVFMNVKERYTKWLEHRTNYHSSTPDEHVCVQSVYMFT